MPGAPARSPGRGRRWARAAAPPARSASGVVEAVRRLAEEHARRRHRRPAARRGSVTRFRYASRICGLLDVRSSAQRGAHLAPLLRAAYARGRRGGEGRIEQRRELHRDRAGAAAPPAARAAARPPRRRRGRRRRRARRSAGPPRRAPRAWSAGETSPSGDPLEPPPAGGRRAARGSPRRCDRAGRRRRVHGPRARRRSRRRGNPRVEAQPETPRPSTHERDERAATPRAARRFTAPPRTARSAARRTSPARTAPRRASAAARSVPLWLRRIVYSTMHGPWARKA